MSIFWPGIKTLLESLLVVWQSNSDDKTQSSDSTKQFQHVCPRKVLFVKKKCFCLIPNWPKAGTLELSYIIDWWE